MSEDKASDWDDEMAQCEICGKTFFYEAILNIHIRNMHRDTSFQSFR